MLPPHAGHIAVMGMACFVCIWTPQVVTSGPRSRWCFVVAGGSCVWLVGAPMVAPVRPYTRLWHSLVGYAAALVEFAVPSLCRPVVASCSPAPWGHVRSPKSARRAAAPGVMANAVHFWNRHPAGLRPNAHCGASSKVRGQPARSAAAQSCRIGVVAHRGGMCARAGQYAFDSGSARDGGFSMMSSPCVRICCAATRAVKLTRLLCAVSFARFAPFRSGRPSGYCHERRVVPLCLSAASATENDEHGVPIIIAA